MSEDSGKEHKQKINKLKQHIETLNIDIQKRVPILYDGKEIGLHILDLVVEDNVIVELKAVKCFNACHMAQLLSYLKATEIKVGLLLNFSDSVLKIKRVIN